MQNFKEILDTITAFAFDIDGVLTDGSVLLMPNGEQLRSLDSKDAYALQLAIKKGFKVAIISGGNSEQVKMRMKELGVTDVFLRAHTKIDVFEDWLLANDLKEVVVIGTKIPTKSDGKAQQAPIVLRGRAAGINLTDSLKANKVNFYYYDKKITEEMLSKIDPNTIESVHVIKGNPLSEVIIIGKKTKP